MLSEDNVILYQDYVIGIIWIVFFQMHKDFKFYSSLMLEALLISDELNSYEFLRFMIKALKCLSEAALSKELHDLKLVPDVILNYDLIVPALIIIAKVVRMLRGAFDFFRSNSQIVDLLIIQDFPFLMISELIHEKLESLGRCYGKLKMIENLSRFLVNNSHAAHRS